MTDRVTTDPATVHAEAKVLRDHADAIADAGKQLADAVAATAAKPLADGVTPSPSLQALAEFARQTQTDTAAQAESARGIAGELDRWLDGLAGIQQRGGAEIDNTGGTS